jgi:hypothetical protein
VSATAAVDHFTGNAYERAEATASVGWVRQTLTAGLSAGVAEAVQFGTAEQAGDRTAFVELSSGYMFDEHWALGARARAVWSRQPRLTERSGFDWLAGLSFSYQDRDIL